MNASHPMNEEITSGSTISYWLDTLEPIVFNPLNTDRQTEVLIIGGGISGITTAYCLSILGKKVILVEDGYVGSGESGRTTAHLTYALDDRFYDLEKKFGTDKTKIIAESHKKAIDFIEQTVIKEQIDCGFKRVDGYLFSDPSDEDNNLDKEYETTQRLKLPTEMLNEIPSFVSKTSNIRCIRFPEQAQFHVLKYLKGLTDVILKNGGEIYTQSKADEISEKGAVVNGYHVIASHIVVATNTPINNLLTLHTKQWPYRTYVIAALIPKGILPYSLWWDTGSQKSKWVVKPYHYVRLDTYNQEFDILLSGGEDHRTAQADEENYPEVNRYGDLIAWTREHFPYFEEPIYKWSGQVLEPIDRIAFIGKNPGNENIYIITGDSGNGMTHGTIGGLLISDLITGNPNEWEEIYNPSRITLKTADEYLSEVGNMTFKMLKDWVLEDIEKPSQLQPGEGGILTKNLRKIAVYRDENGLLHGCSGVCTHLGGVLHWNDEEKSFDCPLHGSRFTPYGKVINGPAMEDLEKIDIPGE